MRHTQKPDHPAAAGGEAATHRDAVTRRAFLELGSFGALPPGEGGLNFNGGLTFLWHSHKEKELANNDVFPGGMLSNLVIEPPGVPIP